jgi:hypothetical protein
VDAGRQDGDRSAHAVTVATVPWRWRPIQWQANTVVAAFNSLDFISAEVMGTEMLAAVQPAGTARRASSWWTLSALRRTRSIRPSSTD